MPQLSLSPSKYPLTDWIKRVFKRRWRLKAADLQPQSFQLLDLPPEILLCILDQATLIDGILLSQTCKALHELLSAKCRSLFYQSNNRMSLRNEISWRLPEFRLCLRCDQLHRYVDVPGPGNLRTGSSTAISHELTWLSESISTSLSCFG